MLDMAGLFSLISFTALIILGVVQINQQARALRNIGTKIKLLKIHLSYTQAQISYKTIRINNDDIKTLLEEIEEELKNVQ